MRTTRKVLAGLSGLMMTTALPVCASDLSINGFATMAISQLDTDSDADNYAQFLEPYSSDLDFKNGSLFAVQIKQKVNDMVSVTGQLISRGSKNFETEAAWAYVSITPTDTTTLRMGKLRAPFYYYSDFLEVGYAYNWVRPPKDVYYLPFSSLEGIDITQSFSLGSVDASVQAYTGKFDEEMNVGFYTPVQLDNFSGLIFSATWQDFTFRASMHRWELNIPFYNADYLTGLFEPEFQALALPLVAQAYAITELELDPSNPAFEPTVAALMENEEIIAIANAIGSDAAASTADDFAIDGDASKFAETALVYNSGNHFAIFEYTKLVHDQDSFVDYDAWFASYAYRIEQVTPSITISERQYNYESGLNGEIQKSEFEPHDKVSGITLGLRYDFATNTALKVELQKRTMESVSGDDDLDGILSTVSIDVVF